MRWTTGVKRWDEELDRLAPTRLLALGFVVLGCSTTGGIVLTSTGTTFGFLIGFTLISAGLQFWGLTLRRLFQGPFGRDQVALVMWIAIAIGLLIGMAIGPFSEGDDTVETLLFGALLGGLAYLAGVKFSNDEARRRQSLPPPPPAGPADSVSSRP